MNAIQKFRKQIARLFYGMPTEMQAVDIPLQSTPTAAVSERSDSLFANYSFLNTDFKNRKLIFEHLEKEIHKDADTSLAFLNIVSMANTEMTISFNEDIDDKQVSEMIAYLHGVSKDWHTIGGYGINGIIQECLAQVATYGTTSFEYYFSEDLSQVKNVIFVSPKEIIYRREGNAFKPYQSVNGKYIPMFATKYVLTPFLKSPDTPYSYIPFLAAVYPSLIDSKMTESIAKLVDNLSLVGFLQLLIAKPNTANLNESLNLLNKDAQSTSQAQSKQAGLLKSIIDKHLGIFKKGFKDGYFVGFKDDHEFKFHPLASQNTQGVSELKKINNESKFAGFKQPPLMFGRNFNVAQTMADAFLAQFSSHVGMYQKAVADSLCPLFHDALLIAGFKDVKYVKVSFAKPDIYDKEKLARSEGMAMDNIFKKLEKGIISINEAANELGYEQPATNEANNDTDADTQLSVVKLDAKLAKVYDNLVSQYFNELKGISDTQIKQLKTELKKLLSDIPTGASEDYIKNEILSLINDNYDLNGTKQVVNEFISKGYESYLKSQDKDYKMQASDYNIIDFFNQFDSFYLGKFIKDAQTEKAVFKWILENYLFLQQPVESNVIDKLTDDLGKVLIDKVSDVRILTIVKTTLHSLQMIAQLKVMQSEGIKTFEIRGVVDKFQCVWCKALQGKRISVDSALAKITDVMSKPINEYPNLKPFVNQTGLKGSDIEKMSSEDLISKGIFLPPFHINCRDIIIPIQ